MRLHIIGASACIIFLAGCAGIDTQISESDKTRPLVTAEAAKPAFSTERQRPKASVRTPVEAANARPVTANISNIPLRMVLEEVAPGFVVIPEDGDVDLKQSVTVNVSKMPLMDFLSYLSNTTDMHYAIRGRRIYVSSVMTKRWNLAALATARSAQSSVGSLASSSNGGGGGDDDSGGGGFTVGSSGGDGGDESGASQRGTKMKVTQIENQWKTTIDDLKSVLGADGEVLVLQSIGLVQARGKPSKIRAVDGWLDTVAKETTRNVHLSVQAFDVTLNDSKGRGIDWSTLIQGTFESTGEVAVNLFGSSPLDITNEGVFGASIDATQNDDAVSGLFNFLGQYGEVEIITQPQVTVTNGATAVIANGDEFSYISEVSTIVGGDGVTVNNPEFTRLLVGVTMAVTPRILDDGRILVNVVPVISTLTRFDQVNSGTFSTSQPNIALQELATQVITRSGKPIQIGGLISSRVSTALNRLPTRDKQNTGLLGWLFRSDRNELERRELVITITPTVVGA